MRQFHVPLVSRQEPSSEETGRNPRCADRYYIEYLTSKQRLKIEMGQPKPRDSILTSRTLCIVAVSPSDKLGHGLPYPR